MTITLPALAKNLKRSVVRIVAQYDERPMVGTGFFITSNAILTCAHVLLGENDLSARAKGKNPESALQRRLKTMRSIDIETADGKKLHVSGEIRVDGAKDIGMIRVRDAERPLEFSQTPPEQGEDIFMCGYPSTIQIDDVDSPYAACKGFIMSEGMFRIGGYEKRSMMQIFCPSFGGASGSPIFSPRSGKVVGMLNGQMRWGDDNFVFMEKDAKGRKKFVRDALHVPLPFGFMTTCAILKRTIDDVLLQSKTEPRVR